MAHTCLYSWASYQIWKNCRLHMRRECRERFPPPSISKETDSLRSRHASRHVRDAGAVMHVGIYYPRWRGKRPGIPGACASAILRIWQEAHETWYAPTYKQPSWILITIKYVSINLSDFPFYGYIIWVPWVGFSVVDAYDLWMYKLLR